MTKNPRVLIVAGAPETFFHAMEPALAGLEHEVLRDHNKLSDTLDRFQPTACYAISGDGITKPDMHAVARHPSVEWLANGGSGVEHLRGHGRPGLTVTNMAGVLSHILAEFALTGIMMGNVDFRRAQRAMPDRKWDRFFWTPVVGKTLCIVGLGSVGRDLARQAANVGIRVTGVRASGADTPYVERVYTPDRLTEAVADADFIAVHAAETPGSVGLVNAETFAAMKDDVVFLNAARGPVVDQEALTKAVSTPGRIRCAILDVFNVEPLPADDPLWDMPNVIVTPHMADNVPDWQARYAKSFAANLERFRAGEPLENIVDLDRGY